MLNHFHILVVDDEPVQREMIGGFLKKQGFEVIAADSAERALELFRQDAFEPRVVSLDRVHRVVERRADRVETGGALDPRPPGL